MSESVTAPIATEEVNLYTLMDCPHIDGWERMRLRDVPVAIPVRSALKGEQLAIHMRAYEEGYQAASRYLKNEITRNFELAMLGHVL